MVTNPAARLQAQATAGEILLGEKMHKRDHQWLREHGLLPVAETLSLKGFDAPVTAYRLAAPVQVTTPSEARDRREQQDGRLTPACLVLPSSR